MEGSENCNESDNLLNVERLRERQKLAYEGLFYSIQRIDLLIISICSGGIYVSLETLRYLPDNLQGHNAYIKVAGIAFLFGIIANFLSQTCGFNANKCEYLKCFLEIDCSESDETSEVLNIQIKKYDKKGEKYSNWTNYLNIASMSLMFLGLLTITTFFLITF